MVIGLLSSVAEFTVSLVVTSASSFPLVADPAILGTLYVLIALLIVPVALFIIIYFIASGASTDLRRTFLHVIGSLFVGAALGDSGALAAFSNGFGGQPFASLASYAEFGISVITFSLEVALIGFSAMALQYLLSGKLSAPLK
ncbi:MAG: hypothetical protein ACRECH_12060 [Nitrososphaerales archaeon]